MTFSNLCDKKATFFTFIQNHMYVLLSNLSPNNQQSIKVSFYQHTLQHIFLMSWIIAIIIIMASLYSEPFV